MCKRIAKQKAGNLQSIIVKPSPVYASDKITFSFSALERTEYFNLDGTCANWSSDLFEMLNTISTLSKVELLSGKYKTFRVHNHENATPPNELPQGVELKDLYQLRISSSKGGIHGVFSDNVFYVIWLDPLHNMYPDDRYGGLRTITPPSTCCMERDLEIDRLKYQYAALKRECDAYEELLNDACK